jgi:hypothetical protein
MIFLNYFSIKNESLSQGAYGEDFNKIKNSFFL